MHARLHERIVAVIAGLQVSNGGFHCVIGIKLHFSLFLDSNSFSLLIVFFLSLYWSCYNSASVVFMFWFFGREACGILGPQTRIEPPTPASEGEVLSTELLREVP